MNMRIKHWSFSKIVCLCEFLGLPNCAIEFGYCFIVFFTFLFFNLQGRDGKGSIFVWASGNGGADHDDCNADGYANSIYTLVVSSTTENQDRPFYSEHCSASLASTYSSGNKNQKMVVSLRFILFSALFHF